MTIQADIVTALAGVASGRVYPQIAPENATYPLVNYRILNKAPITTIHGTTLATDYTVVFECWATTYSGALTLAESVRTAINASTLNKVETDEPGEEYDVQADSFMEPVYYVLMK